MVRLFWILVTTVTTGAAVDKVLYEFCILKGGLKVVFEKL